MESPLVNFVWQMANEWKVIAFDYNQWEHQTAN